MYVRFVAYYHKMFISLLKLSFFFALFSSFMLQGLASLQPEFLLFLSLFPEKANRTGKTWHN